MHMNETPDQATSSVINCIIVYQSKSSALLAYHCQKIKLDVEVSELVLTTVFTLHAFCTLTHTERHTYSKATYR